MIILFIIGIFMGSFLLCLAMNWHKPQHVLFEHSTCDRCGHTLSSVDLIPLLSFLRSRGRCRYCHCKLPSIYFFAELLGGLLFLSTFTYISSYPDQGLLIFLFISILLLMSYCDLVDFWVPDLLQVVYLCIILYHLLSNNLVPSIVYVFFICLLFLCIYTLAPTWIGGADIKFIIISSLILTVEQFPLFLFIASALGITWLLIIPKRYLPFIPCLVTSLLITYFLL